MTGIYGILNTVTGQWYIGQALNIERRNIEERRNLSRGRFHRGKVENAHIVNAWKKYGENAFAWVVLEECSADDLNDREVFWISAKDSYNNGYNQTVGGGGRRGYHLTEEQRKNLSEAQKRRNYHHTEEAKRKNREAHKRENLSPETRQKMSISQKKRKRVEPSPEMRELISKKIREAKEKPVVCLETGTVFPSINTAAEWAKTDRRNISATLKERQKTAGGYHWQYYSEVNL